MMLIALAACFSLYFSIVSGFALPWIVTSYVEIHISTLITATTFTAISVTETALIETRIVQVIPTATPLTTLSVVTTVNQYNSEVTLVEVLLPTGAGRTATDNAVINPTSYYVQLFYTAPSSCASQWVYSTTAFVGVPYQVTPTVTSVSTIFTQPQAFGPTSTKFIAWMNPTDIPAADLSTLSSRNAPLFSSSCSIPYRYTATGTSPVTGSTTTPNSGGSGSSSGSSSGENNWSGCLPFVWYFAGAEMGQGYICDDGLHYTKGISITSFVLAWIFSWLGFFLIIGLIESYVTFSKLACGEKARRGLPVAFSCLFPFLSCFFLCCSNRGYVAKPPEEQLLLKEQWHKTPVLTRIGRWIQWGFRYKYPPFFGIAPPRRGKWGENTTVRNVVQESQPSAAPPEYFTPVETKRVELEQPHHYHEMQSPTPLRHELPSPEAAHEINKPRLDSTIT